MALSRQEVALDRSARVMDIAESDSNSNSNGDFDISTFAVTLDALNELCEEGACTQTATHIVGCSGRSNLHCVRKVCDSHTMCQFCDSMGTSYWTQKIDS